MASGINKKAEKKEFSWTEKWETKSNGKTQKHEKEIKGWWQLRVKYKTTNDTIAIQPYITINGSKDHNKKVRGFKESKTCTIKITYEKFDPAKKYTKTDWRGDDWDKEHVTRSDKIQTDGDHKGFWKNLTPYRTYSIKITAKIGTQVSSTRIAGTAKPTTPQSVLVVDKPGQKNDKYIALEHNVDAPSKWTIWFSYKPKGGTNDYAAPVNTWHIARKQDTEESSWSEIKYKFVDHDPNGFNDKYVDNLTTSTGSRYKWKVWFENSAGAGSSKTYPPNKENDVPTKGRHVVSQLDLFKEWAYMPPNAVSNVNGNRDNKGIGLAWDRNLDDVRKGCCQGYFLQYIVNGDHDARDKESKWKWWHFTKKTTRNGIKYTTNDVYYIDEDPTHTSEYDKRKNWTHGLDDNQRISFRLVPYNFDRIDLQSGKIRPGGKHVQKAEASEAIGPFFFKPAAADNISATKKMDGNRKVVILYDKASKKSVNCARLFIKYRYTDKKTSEWLRYDWQQAEPTGLIDIVRNSKEKTFTDTEEIPPVHNNKTVNGFKYAVRLGVDAARDSGGNDEFYPDIETLNAFSSLVEMNSWVSNLTNPDKPTLIFPEHKKAYYEDTESISLTWTHNPKDGTDQTAAEIDIFVFPREVGSIPSDFYSYNMGASSAYYRNHVSIEGIETYHNIDVQNETFYKITELDRTNKTIENWSTKQSLSPNDRILWRVRTKGSYTGSPNSGYSDYASKLRWFVLYGKPKVNLTITNLVHSEDLDADILPNLPLTVTWDYEDVSGTLDSLTLSISKDNETLDTYDVDLTRDTSHSFYYLFDNDTYYSVNAYASSTTTLTSASSAEFLVSYVSVELKQDIMVTADFQEATGVAELVLSKSLIEDTFNDASEITIAGEDRIATSIRIWKTGSYDPNTGYLVIKALLDKPMEGLYLATTPTELQNFNDAFPGGEEDESNPSEGESTNRYPGESVYPFDIKITNQNDLEYTLWDGDVTEGYNFMYLSLWIPPDYGYFNAVYEGQTTQVNFLSYHIYTIPKTGDRYIQFAFRDEEETLSLEYSGGNTYTPIDLPLNYELRSGGTVIKSDTFTVPMDSEYDFHYICDWEPNYESEEFVIPNIESQLMDIFGYGTHIEVTGIDLVDGSVVVRKGQYDLIVYDFRIFTGPLNDELFPITGVLYDDLDGSDSTETPVVLDELPKEVYLYRTYKDSKTFIGVFYPNFNNEEVEVASITDRFCPINNDFEYEMVILTENNHISVSEMTFNFKTLYWYCYWGPTYDNVAKARWNPNGSASFSRPERQEVRYSGRRFPVVYDSDAVNETYSFSVELFDDDYTMDYLGDYDTALETLDNYRQLMFDGGVGFWKSFEGDVYFASFDFSYTVDFTDGIKKYPCTLNVTRIEGDEVF